MKSEPKQKRSGVVAHRRPSSGAERHRRGGENGFVLVFSAMLLVVLMVFAAFAVDLGSWYSRAAQLQRGADAGALAGVVWMPNDFDKATTEARKAAARNGLVHGQDNVTILVTRVPNQPQQLQVEIVDANVETYFGKMAVDHITLRRLAIARFVLPVPLGSPLNGFGNQGVPPNSSVTNNYPQFWAAINAPYTGKTQGDPYATKCTTVPNARPAACSGLNDQYRPEGYLYAIAVRPGDVGRTLTVEVFDAPFFGGTLGVGVGEGYVDVGGQSAGPSMSFELFEADDTPLDNSDNPTTFGRCNSGPGRLVSSQVGTQNLSWTRVCRITVAKAGVYPFRVKSSAIAGQPDQGAASSHYSVRAILGGGGSQPRVYALNDMSIYTGLNTTSTADADAEFYLAEVEQAYAGKGLSISLYDPGDGTDGNFYLTILQPDGSDAQCSFNEPNGTINPVQRCRIRTRVKNGSPANRYDGKWLEVNIALDPGYTCTSNCWWKVKYEFRDNARPTDRTVWRASVTGDPVGLIK